MTHHHQHQTLDEAGPGPPTIHYGLPHQDMITTSQHGRYTNSELLDNFAIRDHYSIGGGHAKSFLPHTSSESYLPLVVPQPKMATSTVTGNNYEQDPSTSRTMNFNHNPDSSHDRYSPVNPTIPRMSSPEQSNGDQRNESNNGLGLAGTDIRGERTHMYGEEDAMQAKNIITKEHGRENNGSGEDQRRLDEIEAHERRLISQDDKLTMEEVARINIQAAAIAAAVQSHPNVHTMPARPNNSTAVSEQLRNEVWKMLPSPSHTSTTPTRRRSKDAADKPFKCLVEGCPSAFHQVCNLRTHEIVKHGRKKKFERTSVKSGLVNKPFKCMVEGCTSAFLQAGNLRTHEIQKHGRPKKFSRKPRTEKDNMLALGGAPFPHGVSGVAGFNQGYSSSEPPGPGTHGSVEKPFFPSSNIIKPFQCKVPGCQASYSQAGNLRTHEVQKHGRPKKFTRNAKPDRALSGDSEEAPVTAASTAGGQHYALTTSAVDAMSSNHGNSLTNRIPYDAIARTAAWVETLSNSPSTSYIGLQNARDLARELVQATENIVTQIDKNHMSPNSPQ